MGENVLKQIEELSDKAAKYEHMKERYVKIGQKLKEAMDIIQEALKELDPIAITSSKLRNTDKGTISNMLEETYKRLQVGQQVSLESMEKWYPDVPIKTIQYIFYNKLGKAPQVKKRRDGRQMILYIQKEI